MYVLVVATLVYMVPTMAARGFEPSDWRGFIIPFMFLVVIPGSVCWSAWSNIRHLQPKQRQHRYQFADNSIRLDTGLSTASVDWAAVGQVVENRRAFCLFLQKSIFHVVPKRGLRGKDDLDRLRAMLQAKLGPRAKIRTDASGVQA
jgi:hypothetical protein